jgi:hypothetical protein
VQTRRPRKLTPYPIREGPQLLFDALHPGLSSAVTVRHPKRAQQTASYRNHITHFERKIEQFL